MSELKIVSDPVSSEPLGSIRSSLPVLADEATLTRRDLDLIKRDLITVRKDYNEIRENMVILTHQYSSAPSKSFFIAYGVVWLLLLVGLMVFQPQLSDLTTTVLARISHH